MRDFRGIKIDGNSDVKMNFQIIVDGEVKEEEEFDKIIGVFIKEDECDDDSITTNMLTAGNFNMNEMISVNETWDNAFPAIAASYTFGEVFGRLKKDLSDM